MIKLGSISYPYLAIAQNYGISYREVLNYVDYLEDKVKMVTPPYSDWRRDTFLAHKNEMERRKQVSGV